MEFIFTVLWIVAFVWTLTVARNNNRSMIVWGLVALIFSPIISLISLWLLGKHYDL